MKSATEAAEPLEEPPGVCVSLCGLRVRPGVKVANSVVTVLPRISAPARRAVDSRAVAGVDRRAVPGGHVAGVEDVLHAHRQAVQQPAHRAAVQRARLRKRHVAIQEFPGLHAFFACFDPVEAGIDEVLGADHAARELHRELGGGVFVERFHAGTASLRCIGLSSIGITSRVASMPRPILIIQTISYEPVLSNR